MLAPTQPILGRGIRSRRQIPLEGEAMKRLVLVLAAVAVAAALMPTDSAQAEILAVRIDPPWVTDGDPEDPYGTLPVVSHQVPASPARSYEPSRTRVRFLAHSFVSPYSWLGVIQRCWWRAVWTSK
jgi:hypothetical protein